MVNPYMIPYNHHFPNGPEALRQGSHDLRKLRVDGHAAVAVFVDALLPVEDQNACDQLTVTYSLAIKAEKFSINAKYHKGDQT